MKTDREFEQELMASGMVHFRMLPDDRDSLDRFFAEKDVKDSAPLWDGREASAFVLTGNGSAVLSKDTEGAVLLSAPARMEHWPEGCPEDGDYCNFGALNASLIPSRSDWRAYNRIVFEVYPRTKGMHSPMLSLQLYNDGEVKIPDRYMREGFHTVYLRNGRWNTVIWEFPSLPRDLVTGFTFQVNSYGKELSMEDVISVEIRNIRLEAVEQVSHTLGWETDPGLVVCPTNGYAAEGKKTAVTSEEADIFTVVRADSDETVFSGKTEIVVNEKGTFTVCDLSVLCESGTYRIKCGNAESPVFTISGDPWYRALWKAVNYLYSERCGCPIGRGHGTCHTDILAKHAGKTIVYNGGWHDAGDVSQQTLQTGEVASALLKAAEAVRGKHTALYARIMEEAAWGIDFVLKTRFGDGFRATSAGICRWTDGFIGTFDDCAARVHDHSFENYLLAGVEAEAATGFRTMDPELSDKCIAAAIEDFAHAEKAFAERGPELPSFYEHTYNSSISLYHAVAARTAARLYEQTGDGEYEQAVARHLAEVMNCQETGGTGGCPVRGFFYRDDTKKTIVHFNHQARYECFTECFTEALRVLPDHAENARWRQALALYGEYLKCMSGYSAPYGMQPAGIHKTDEYLDSAVFELLHLLTAYEDEKENYKEQLENAAKLTPEYVVRMFPVWFSFRGNAAVHLSEGLSAANIGACLCDEQLTEIGREQLYFLFGRNPFGQSLMYGEGSRFPALYGALNGEMTGAVPVGMETRGNEDVPYWPVENNATYKEVWTSSVGKVLTLIAALSK